MTPLRFLSAAVAALLVVLALVFSLRRGATPVAPHAAWGSQAVFEELSPLAIEMAAGTSERIQLEVGHARIQEDEPDCHGSPIDGFRNYVADFMALDEPGRARKLEEPAAALLALSGEDRARLGLGRSAKIRTENEEVSTPGFRLVVEPKAVYALIDHWQACAQVQGLDLAGEMLVFLNVVTLPALESAEPSSLELACDGLRSQLTDPANARRIGVTMLTLLRGIQSREPDWDLIDSVVYTATSASWGTPTCGKACWSCSTSLGWRTATTARSS